MREYQPKKNNPNWMPTNQYMQTIYFIRSYYDLKAEYDTIINESSTGDGPKGSMPGDPTAKKVLRLEQIHDDIRIIDSSLKRIPEEYRQTIWDNIVCRSKYKGFAGERTISRWKGRFIRDVARQKGIT